MTRGIVRPMDSAPRTDGTRILVRVAQLGSILFQREPRPHPKYGWFKLNGWAWQECWFDGTHWQPWSGNYATKSTGAWPDDFDYVSGWSELPA